MPMPADLILLLAMAISPAAPSAALVRAIPAVTLAQAGPPAEGWRGAPPPPEMERVHPRRGYVWVEGGADWRRGKYVRRRGHWELSLIHI